MKALLLLAAVALLILPSTAFADGITVFATAPNNNGPTQGTTNSNYNGGTGQFDLDHHYAYTWQINNVLAAGQTAGSITGATLTFSNVANWDTTANKLFVHLLNTARNSDTSINHGIASVVDATGVPVPVTQISDFFTIADNALEVVGGAGDTLLFEHGFNMVGQSGSYFAADGGVGAYTARDFVYTFSATQVQALRDYLTAGNNIAFGFDPDCHYWNNGITFQFTTATPEPATLALLGTGLMSTGFYLRRRRQTKAKNQE